MENNSIWPPIEFDDKWNHVNTEKFDNIYPSWTTRRKELQKNQEQYERFMDQLKRKQAIDTGIIEGMYDLKRGITETFVKEGFADSYLQHGDTNIDPQLLMKYLGDNFEAINSIFDFVKNDRPLSVGYIKELHSLLTRHPETTDAIDQLEISNSIVTYCPPEQAALEMDHLIRIFNNDLTNVHILVKAAFLHHAFIQIHPFQNSNGRIARLLASFALIKEGLFPLSIDRDEKTIYTRALERAAHHDYQDLISVFSNNQIISIEKAPNWEAAEDLANYEDMLSALAAKLSSYRVSEADSLNRKIEQNMRNLFAVINEELNYYACDLREKLDEETSINVSCCAPDDTKTYHYSKQINEYAKQFGYYANLSLNKCWTRILIELDKTKRYLLVISLHHYGYDNSTFALGSILLKEITPSAQNSSNKKEYKYIPSGIEPLSLPSEIKLDTLYPCIRQQVQISIMSMFSYIFYEL